MKTAIIFISVLMTFGVASAQDKLSLGLCDTLPKGFYKMDIDTLIIQNAMGYCESPFKTLDKRIVNFKNLKVLDFHSDYSSIENLKAKLPAEIAQLSKLISVSTNLPNAALLQMSKLKSLSLHSFDNLSLLSETGLAKLEMLEELSISFPALKNDYYIRGVSQLKNLKSVTLRNPNQAIVDEVLSNPNIEYLNIKHTSEEITLDFRYTTNLKTLILENNYIKEIPSSIFILKNLEVLQISSNELTKINEEITNLSNLKELNFRNNNLTILGGYISKLDKLEKLDLSGNKHLSSLPVELGLLSNLKMLAANGCILVSVPQEISNCSQLEELWLDNNLLTGIRVDFSNLKKLTKLTLHKNKIGRVHASLFQLPLLETLDLSDNAITELPRSIKEMKSLTSFQVVNNQIVRLPEDLGDCKLLETVSVYNNKIVKLPPSIFKLTELENLYCGNNEIVLFPTSFSTLKKLQALEMQSNPLTAFPSEIYDLPSLDRVWVSASYKTLKGFKASAKNPMTIFTN